MKVIESVNATFSYDGKTNIFEDISFSVEQGEVFLIVGPNGCGKSTLIDNLLGLKKLNNGSILLDARNINDMKPNEIAQAAAFVPQGHIKSFAYKVLEIVMMGRAFASGLLSPPGEKDKEIAMNALEQVGMTGFYDREYTTLSGGELQLVLIARALAQKSRLLIMDEPTAHLDFRHELNVLEIIGRLVKENGISIVMATHFLNQAYYFENVGVRTRVALMDEKNFERVGTPSDVLTPENLESVFNITARVASDGPDGRKFILALHNSKVI
jgi:iron complex transport system ATP-binding protein